MDTVDRFVDKYIVLVNGCWEWQGATNGKGYGMFSVDGECIGAHVFSWSLVNGRSPATNMLIRHTCNNSMCVNPDHLIEGTKRDNALDLVATGTHNQLVKTHCQHGHEYTLENTMIVRGTHRRCRECDRQGRRRRNA